MSKKRTFVDVLMSGPKLPDDDVDELFRRPHYVHGIDHVQIAVPEGSEQRCRDFYLGIIEMIEIPRPEHGAGRSFLWVRVGEQEIHFRPDPTFEPARFAHPGFLVGNAEALAARLEKAGYEVTREQAVGPGRFHTRDPFGNRLEFIESGR